MSNISPTESILKAYNEYNNTPKNLHLNLIVIGVNITFDDKNNKKEIFFPTGWQKTKESMPPRKSCGKRGADNALVLQTGVSTRILVLDVDSMEKWEKFLKERDLLDKWKREVPSTTRSKTRKGYHYFYALPSDLSELPSSTNTFGEDCGVDIRCNKGCAVLPPSKYFIPSENVDFEYKWERDITKNGVSIMPGFLSEMLKQLLNSKNKLKSTKTIKTSNAVTLAKNSLTFAEAHLAGQDTTIAIQSSHNNQTNNEALQAINAVEQITLKDVEAIVGMLEKHRSENYTDWRNVGFALHSCLADKLISADEAFHIWEKFSKQICRP